MDEKHTIRFADGMILENLELNGNNYIADHVISDTLFSAENLEGVIINGEYHKRMVLDGKNDVDGRTWFILRDMTQDEERMEAIEAAIIEMAASIYGGEI